MRSVIMLDGLLKVVETPVPVPGPGDVLVKVLATGICGSDLHAVTHTDELLTATTVALGGPMFDRTKPLSLGHEFCAEVVAYGPDTEGTLAPGTRVVSPPFLQRGEALAGIGWSSTDMPGGYSEYLLLSEDLLIAVPDHVPTEVAALTEPMAVALHAYRRGDLGQHDVPLVIGCGPIGLAVIAVLKAEGRGPVVAADFSATRRALALELGADAVVDPRERSPYEAWAEFARTDDPAQMAQQNVFFQSGLRPAAVFECVGVPSMLEQVLDGIAPASKVIVAGVCMQRDAFLPVVAVLKEIDLVFVFGFTVPEYAEAFDMIAAGTLHVAPLVTSTVGLDGVAAAFDSLADPEVDVKVIVDPSLV